MQANLTYHTPTVESISELVHAFYADVRQDALLGPVFDEALNGQWDEHLHRLVDFWSTVLLGSRSFKGNVLGKHMQLQGITPAHFAAWVRLWNEHTARLCHTAPRSPSPRGLSASRPFANHGGGDCPPLIFNKPAPQAQAFVLPPLAPRGEEKCHADGDQRDRPPDAKQFAQADADEPQVGQQKKYAQNNQHDGCDVALHLHSLLVVN